MNKEEEFLVFKKEMENFNYEYRKHERVYEIIDKQSWIDDESFDERFLDCLNPLTYYQASGLCSKIVRKTFVNEKLKDFFIRISKHEKCVYYFKIYLFINNLCSEEDIVRIYLKKGMGEHFYYDVVNRLCKESFSKLTKSKDSRVRAISYGRLPILDYIDEILEDKSKEVRMIGIKYLDFGDKRLKKLALKERAGHNMLEIAKKLSYNDLVFLVGKKSRSKWLNAHMKKVVQERMNEGY